MIAKAIGLLYRWLAHDVGGMRSDGEDMDLTLDDETNDLLLAYSVPRAELDQAVLDAMAAVSDEHCHWYALYLHPVWKVEWARRQAKAAADAARRQMLDAGPELRERARSALRRLDSLR